MAARKFHAPFASAQLHQICERIATVRRGPLSADRDIDACAPVRMLRELRVNIDTYMRRSNGSDAEKKTYATRSLFIRRSDMRAARVRMWSQRLPPLHTRTPLVRRAHSLWMSLEWHCRAAAANLSYRLAPGADLDIITVAV